MLMIQTHARENTCVRALPAWKLISGQLLGLLKLRQILIAFSEPSKCDVVVITSFQKAGKACGDLPFRDTSG